MITPEPASHITELGIFNHTRRLFEIIHEDVHKHIPKIDRMSTGMKMLQDLNEIIKLLRKAYDEKDRNIKRNYIEHIISLTYDIDCTCILWRETKIITVRRQTMMAEHVAEILKQAKKFIKSI